MRKVHHPRNQGVQRTNGQDRRESYPTPTVTDGEDAGSQFPDGGNQHGGLSELPIGNRHAVAWIKRVVNTNRNWAGTFMMLIMSKDAIYYIMRYIIFWHLAC